MNRIKRAPEPGMIALLITLSLDTQIPAIEFGDWLRANQAALRSGFCESDEPHDYSEVEDCLGVWLRMEFRAHMRRVELKQAPPVRVVMTTATQPSTQPEPARAFGFSKMFRWRAP